MIPGIVAKRRGGGVVAPSYHPHIKELMLFEGANNSVAFSSELGRAWTGEAGAKLSTTTPWQGLSKGVIAASGQYFKTAAATGLVFGAGDYSIEAWFSCTDANFTLLDIDADAGGKSIIVQGTNVFCYSSVGGYIDTYTNPFGQNLSDGARHYFNLTRNGDQEAIWIDTNYYGFAAITNATNYTNVPAEMNIGRRIGSPTSRPATSMVVEALRIRIGSSMFPIGAGFGAVPLPGDGNAV